ncbi:MAG: hypothetical protein C0601_08860 [Candidatus Muiribacterium halophilum]|uniref:Radical SAM core domain-containing protein n=1 Tax=Muiribacterium halophilum TaxID=2053465 RepID=A0A2N5ZE42_MUIH1|nr:MAG: hypothetical protein C0601_08860 [Candidatus Muirbacterium halophilum]
MSINKTIKTFFNVFSKDRLSYLVFFITGKCNSRCRTCFYWKNLNTSIKDEIPVSEIKTFLKKTGFIPFVSLSGGEPFLRDDINIILDHIAEYSNPFMINIPTNASRKNWIVKVIKRFFKKNNDVRLQIELSLDGIGDMHDKIRGRSGSFKEVMNTLSEIKKLKRSYPLLRLKINSTYNSFNSDNFEELIRFIANQKVDGFSYSYLMGDVKETASKTYISAKVIKKNRQLVKKYNRKKDRSLGLFMDIMQYSYKNELLNLINIGRYRHRCLAGRKIAVVRQDSNVYLCEDDRMKVSSLSDIGYDLNNIKKTGKYKKIRRSMINNHLCDCGWSCELLLFSVRNNLLNISEVIRGII